MESSKLTALFPKLYHVTFASNLPGIQQHGLRSASSLANLHSFDDEEREATIVRRRRCIQNLHGVAIRDQSPANEKKMKTCLVGVTIPEWLTLLNSKIFFFVKKEKALVLAERYSSYPNILLEVDTTQLLASYAKHCTLCRLNAGAFLYNPVPRGRDSFIPLEKFIYLNKKKSTPAELTVDVPIPNIMDIATIHKIPGDLTPAAT